MSAGLRAPPRGRGRLTRGHLPPRPMLATLSADIPAGPEWVFEEKYDGIRALAVRENGAVRLYSRSLQDLTGGFPYSVAAVAALPHGELILDGELVALDEKGISRFQLLQRRGAAGARRTRYAVFDLLKLGGRSLLTRPLLERRAALERLIGRRAGPIFLARRLVRDGKAAYREAKRHGWEGIIAKDEGSSYEPNTRSRAWRKVKIRKESEFVIGGYTPPAGSREHLGALLVGLYRGRALIFVGKVGTGFTRATLRDLGERLAALRREDSPFADEVRERSATWVEPRLVAQIGFSEWTPDGRLRHPRFLGLREDKDPRDVVREKARPR